MFWSNNPTDSHSIFAFQATLTPASVANIVAAEQTFTVSPGTNSSTLPKGTTLKTTDHILCTGPGTGNASGMISCRVSSGTQVIIGWVNPTAGGLTPASGVYKFFVIRT